MPFINSYYKLLLTPNGIISYGEQITNQLDRIYGLGIAFFHQMENIIAMYIQTEMEIILFLFRLLPF